MQDLPLASFLVNKVIIFVHYLYTPDHTEPEPHDGQGAPHQQGAVRHRDLPTLQHYNITPLQHYNITTLPHYNITTSQHYSITECQVSTWPVRMCSTGWE